MNFPVPNRQFPQIKIIRTGEWNFTHTMCAKERVAQDKAGYM